MKTRWVLSFFLVAVSTAAAQVLRPINPSRMADVNQQVLQPEQLSLEQRTLPVLAPGVAPGVTHQRAPLRVITPGLVPRTIRDLPNRDLPSRGLRRAPTRNFAPKRATARDRRAATELVPAGPAPITNRTIVATTPAGQQELREQLRRLP